MKDKIYLKIDHKYYKKSIKDILLLIEIKIKKEYIKNGTINFKIDLEGGLKE